MNTLLRLPFTLLELAARESLKVARGALRLIRPEEHPDDVRVRPLARGEVPRDPVAARTAADAEAPRRLATAPRAPTPRVPAPSRNGPVKPPWEGYDSDSAAEIVRRVRGADDATKAVVLLYEGHRKGRRTVLDAALG
jgi:hypothetical protein